MVSVKEVLEDVGLKKTDLIDIYRTMLLARALSERLWILTRMGRGPAFWPCHGHEACQVGSAYALHRGRDFFVPYYRDLGVALAAGMTPRELTLAFFAKAEDPSSGGRQMPNHFSHAGLRIISGSSTVATQIPIAAGIAFASKLRGESDVTIVYFGDGATSKGDFHEGLNFAGVHRLPVIFFCEHNRYAISVPQQKQMAIENVASRAAGYGFPGITIDGNDVLACYRATSEAAARARAGEGPTLIEAKTYRFQPHSGDDDDRRYRSREEVAQWGAKDPITRFRAYLEEQGLLSASEDEALNKAVASQVDEATDYAERAPYPKPEDALKHVYAEARP